VTTVMLTALFFFLVQTSQLGKHPPCPQLKPNALIRNEVARPHHFMPLQTPEAFRDAGSRVCSWSARSLR
jgi:hypothetical protein